MDLVDDLRASTNKTTGAQPAPTEHGGWFVQTEYKLPKDLTEMFADWDTTLRNKPLNHLSVRVPELLPCMMAAWYSSTILLC